LLFQVYLTFVKIPTEYRPILARVAHNRILIIHEYFKIRNVVNNQLDSFYFIFNSAAWRNKQKLIHE